MELRHLRYFVAVAEEGSFTRAAERLWVAQPGLSTQIRRLENELGLTLFERHSRGAVLTPAGAMLLERARTTLEAAATVEELGRDLGAGRSGSLRLGLCACAGWSGTAPLLERFARENPGIELTVVEAYGGILVRDVRDRRLDAALVAMPFATPELLAAPLGADPLVVALPRGHRLDDEGPMEAGEMADESRLVFGHRDSGAFDRAIEGVLEEMGAPTRPRPGTVGPAFLDPVEAGEAVVVTTAAGCRRREVVMRELEPPRTMPFAILHRDRNPSAVLASFLTAARAATRRLSSRGSPV